MQSKPSPAYPTGLTNREAYLPQTEAKQDRFPLTAVRMTTRSVEHRHEQTDRTKGRGILL